MPHEHTTRSKPAPGYVRTLMQQEKLPLLRDHLLCLDAESRHDRFNGFLEDSFIESYAARCAHDGTVIVAYIENGVVRGAAELHPAEQSTDSLPEIAFSVEAGVSRKGVGTILFRRLIEEARAKGYKTLRITTGAENHAMQALAGKFGAHLAFRDGEFPTAVLVLLAAAGPSNSPCYQRFNAAALNRCNATASQHVRPSETAAATISG